MKRKILLIVSSSNSIMRTVLKKANCSPNLGILYIASVLKMHGYEVKVIDMLVEDFTVKNFINEVKDFNPDVVGVSIFTEAFDNAVEIIKLIKKNCTNVKIVAGGPHVTFEVENTLKNVIDIDYIIRYEGEFPFLLLLEHLNFPEEFPIDKVKGLVYRENESIKYNELHGYIHNLDALPFASIGLIKVEKYKEVFALITSRGCPGDCVYCCSKAMAGNRYRYRSAENVISEVYYLYGKTNQNLFEIYDDTFTVDKSRVERFCGLLKEINLPLIWRCQSRADILSYELIDMLRESNCKYIHIGIESGSQIVLDNIGKKINLQNALEKIRYANKKGAYIFCSFIVGHHCDTKETIESTLKLIKELKAEGIDVGVAACTPYPGTYLNNNAEKLGLKIHAKKWREYQFGNPIVSNSNVSLEELRNYLFRGYKGFFLPNDN